MGYSAGEIADAFIKAGELQDALDVLDQHLDAGTPDVGARRLRAQLRLRLGHLRGALDDLDGLGAPSPDDLHLRSVALERLGDLPAACDAMRGALAASDDAGQRERLSERLLGLLLALERWDDADGLLAQQPETWRWAQWRGDTAARRALWAQAAAHYSAALAQLDTGAAMRPDWLNALKGRLLLVRAQAYVEAGDYPAAAADYDAAAALLPDDPMLDFNRGLLALLAGDPPRALALCRAAHARANETLRAEMRRAAAQERYRALAHGWDGT